jgi:hypothetical protein
MLEIIIEVSGWTGMVLYVVSFAWISSGRTTGLSPRYQLMNIAAAVGVAIHAIYYGAYPSAMVNVVWFAIAAATLIRVGRGSPS